MSNPIEIPAELSEALAANPQAQAIFERMPPSHQRETVGYVAEAKRAETRSKRAAQTVEWILSGKIGGNYRDRASS